MATVRLFLRLIALFVGYVKLILNSTKYCQLIVDLETFVLRGKVKLRTNLLLTVGQNKCWFLKNNMVNLLRKKYVTNILEMLFFIDDYVSSVTLGHVLELLTFCVEHHAYHIKNYIISKDLLRRVLVLMKSKHKFLVLSKYLKP